MGRKSRSRSQHRRVSPAEAPGTPIGPTPPATATRVPDPRSLGTAACAAVLLFVLAAVWAAPRASGDIFMGLAGGRDVLDGKLAKPDDWAFTTNGAVWLNQNWGFDALAYATERAAGEGGLLALKAVLILAIAAAAVLAARARGATWTSALLVTAFAAAGARWYLELRANLATYLLGCLLLAILYGSRTRPRLVWLTVPLFAVWANVHGGFMLGFAVVGVWLAARAVSAFRGRGPRQAFREALGTTGALAISIVLAVATSPFGLGNLAYPFTYLTVPEWREVVEWRRPEIGLSLGARSAGELILFVAFIAAMTAWRVLARPRPGADRRADAHDALALWLFDAGLVVLLTSMGISTIRFLPLALVLLAPIAAAQADVMFGGSRGWAAAAVGAAVLAAAMVPFAASVAGTYSRGNARFTDETFFQRLVSADQLPASAAAFLNDNDVTGRVFQDWRWEGYLHWRCPRLKLFIGGRAQQVYTLETLRAFRRFGTDPQPAATLAQWNTHLAVLPLEREYLHLVDLLAFAEGSHWATVFYDGRGAVLADLDFPATRSIAEAVAAGRARFRSGTVAALSEALCRISSGSAVDAQAIATVAAANRALPTPAGPWFMLFAARAHRVQPAWLVRALEGEYDGLTGESGRNEQRLGRLQARLSIAQILANLYGNRPEGARWSATRAELLSQLQSLAAGS